MKDIGSLSHTKWECKYHVVFIPKYRRKAMYKELRQYLGNLFNDLARQKECRIIEGHLCPDHVHALISIPPKYSVSQVMGFIKGKSAIAFARTYGRKHKNFVGQHLRHGVTMFQQWGERRQQCGSTFSNKKRRINALSSCDSPMSGRDKPL